MFVDFQRGLSDAKRWFRKSELCLRNCCGKNVAASSPRPVNPQTESQTASRESMRVAAEAWRALPEPGRAAWGAYAETHGEAIADQRYKDLCGWDVFLPAWRNCSLLGATPPEAPLDQAPPSAVISVEEVATGSDETFSFRIGHGLAPEGHGLLVRITPATATRARRPYSRQARLIAGHTSGSLLPLPANGEVVTFTAPRFRIIPGQRFGLALRVVRLADGVHSRELFADLYRGGSEPPPQTDGGELPAVQLADFSAEDAPAEIGRTARTGRTRPTSASGPATPHSSIASRLPSAMSICGTPVRDVALTPVPVQTTPPGADGPGTRAAGPLQDDDRDFVRPHF